MNVGSSGLIMGERPSSLPAKSLAEVEKHQTQYERMWKQAKTKGEKMATEYNHTKQQKEQDIEESISTWTEQIIPSWTTMKSSKICKKLWSKGLPSCIRGVVWQLSIGNELSLNSFIYAVDDCRENPDSTKEHIRMDVRRTFPQLGLFQENRPLHLPLCNLLDTYASYHPAVGYVQGMSSVAAMLILNMKEEDAYVAFANLLSRFPHNDFFCINETTINTTYTIFTDILQRVLQKVSRHLALLNVTPDMYLFDWILTIFSSSAPIDICSKIWDLYFRDGLVFLFQSAVAILKLYEDRIINEDCTATCAQFLTRLPENMSFDDFTIALDMVQDKFPSTEFSRYFMNGKYIF